jgi:competence protein ComEA
MRPPRGTTLSVVLLLVGLLVAMGRGLFSSGGEPPAFFVEPPPGFLVLLGPGFPRPGVHQFLDGTAPASVIDMTGLVPASRLADDPQLNSPLLSGEALDVICAGTQVTEIKRYWMPAGQRVTLGIPLHPDRMSREDWEVLPGIGPKLALAIDLDRQQNGDFGSIEGLRRVRGVGPKRVEEWRSFFSARR